VVLVTTTVPWLTDDEQRTWRSFVAATRLLFDQLDRELQRDAGMTHADYEILVRLSEEPGGSLRMGGLAERTGSSRSRLSHAVAGLEGEGWVRRERCPTDGRGALAVLTTKGEAALREAAPGHVRGVRRHLFDQLGASQQRALRTIGDAVLDHLEQERADAAEGSPLSPASRGR
jgi:DNA-binding MarR family transcriptional regulator